MWSRCDNNCSILVFLPTLQSCQYYLDQYLQERWCLFLTVIKRLYSLYPRTATLARVTTGYSPFFVCLYLCLSQFDGLWKRLYGICNGGNILRVILKAASVGGLVHWSCLFTTLLRIEVVLRHIDRIVYAVAVVFFCSRIVCSARSVRACSGCWSQLRAVPKCRLGRGLGTQAGPRNQY